MFEVMDIAGFTTYFATLEDAIIYVESFKGEEYGQELFKIRFI